MLSSTSSFDRALPAFRWRRTAALTGCMVLLFTGAWEGHVRSRGYRPGLNNTDGLWALQRERATGDALVVIGDSRTRFDIDPDAWQKASGGQRPLLLGIDGGTARPILKDLADDPSFKGTVVCNVLEILFYAPAGIGIERADARLKYYRNRTVAQVASDYLAIGLEKNLAFLQKDDLSLGAMIDNLPVPNRTGAMVPPKMPPQLGFTGEDNSCKMAGFLENDPTHQAYVKNIWKGIIWPIPGLPLPMRDQMIEDVKKDIDRIQARGGKVIFIRLPSTEEYRAKEEEKCPRKEFWDTLLERTGAPGIHFEDHAELTGFKCPEWSHLCAKDATVFTERLVRVMKTQGLI